MEETPLVQLSFTGKDGMASCAGLDGPALAFSLTLYLSSTSFAFAAAKSAASFAFCRAFPNIVAYATNPSNGP
jgi:hypothetical protein